MKKDEQEKNSMLPARPVVKKKNARLPKCYRETDRHGKTRYYFRAERRGKRILIKGVFGSEEFMTNYMALANGQFAPVVAPMMITRRPDMRTVGSLILDYKANNQQFKLNREGTTKKGYNSRLAQIDRDYGDCPLSTFDRQTIISFLEDFDDAPGAGLDTHKKFKILIKHAMDTGWMAGDPMVGLKRPKGGTIRPWTEDEVAQFIERWPLGTRQHLALMLTLHLGQRRSDTYRMAWSDINPRTGRIKVHQQKTDAKLEIAIHEDLLYVLDDAHRQRGDVVGINDPILKTEAGIGFTVAGFSGWMRDAITAAGLPLDCKVHGLRHLAGVRLVEAGCTDEEAMAILGHTSSTSLRIYTKGAEQRRLGDAAIHKLEQTRNKPVPNRGFKFGTLPKREIKTNS
jgi:enterobacteria phage integrase